MIRILNMVTVYISARSFLRGQSRFFSNQDYDVHVASHTDDSDNYQEFSKRENIEYHFIPFKREIALIADLKALMRAYELVKKLKPEITNVGTPKAGLVGGLAATFVNVPVRVYTLRGLRLETTTGLKRHLLLWMERLACACAHRVICASPSLRERAIQLRLAPTPKLVILRSGTCNGLDATRFMPSAQLQKQAASLRQELRLPLGTPTVGFVGRFVRDKGIAELMDAFTQLYANNSQIRLLLLGDYEEGDPVSSAVRQTIETHPGVVRAGFVADTAPYYQLMDVLALPTYREGFPNAPLEAAAAGKPVVASDATGAVDAVVEGVTGFTIPVGDAGALADALRRLLEDRDLAQQFGQAGQEWVLREFQSQVLWQALDNLYQELLAEAQVQQARKPKRILLATAAGLIALAIPLLFLGRSEGRQRQTSVKSTPRSTPLSQRGW